MLSGVMSSLFLDILAKGEIEFTSYLILLLVVVFLLMVVYTPIIYLKNAPIISVDDRNIKFGNEVYPLSSIKEVIFTGKMPFKYLFNFPMEGSAVIFKTGQVKFVYNDMYTNTSELKVFLKNALTDGLTNEEALKPNYLKLSTERFAELEFNGNHFLTFNGLMFYGWAVFIGVMVFKKPTLFLTNLGALFSVSFVSFIYFAIFSYQMHYFRIENKHLLVKNSLWFWRKHVYNIEDIEEVVFEVPHRLSTSLRVITTDFREKLYPSGNLTNECWLKLKTALEDSAVKVRNEAVVEENE